jgi:regulator of nonsense transcripts 2
MSTLNLTKYISEAASAIVEAKLKMTDVTAAVELCNSLHHMYAEFSSHLLENWHRFLSIKKDDRVSVLLMFVQSNNLYFHNILKAYL